jgi:hypothetical protein
MDLGSSSCYKSGKPNTETACKIWRRVVTVIIDLDTNPLPLWCDVPACLL